MRLGVVIPSYGLNSVSAAPLLKAQQRCPYVERDIELAEFSSSVLTHNHNEAFCYARNQFVKGKWTHVLIMHSDVRPMDDDWLSTFIELYQRSSADVLSCIIPIKNRLGLTSTAIDTDRWNPRRITLQEAKRLPNVWTHEKLLINTGLLLIDLSVIAYLSPPLCFRFHDAIFEDEKGMWSSSFEPEDWNFSRQCHERKLSVWVTRALNIHHWGIEVYPTAPAWGSETDVWGIPLKDELVVHDAYGAECSLGNA